jgi:hypothetical protein
MVADGLEPGVYSERRPHDRTSQRRRLRASSRAIFSIVANSRSISFARSARSTSRAAAMPGTAGMSRSRCAIRAQYEQKVDNTKLISKPRSRGAACRRRVERSQFVGTAPPPCQVDQATFQSPNPSSIFIDGPPVLV